MELKAYEGPEKYVFVSYAHKDSTTVFRVLSQLVDKGYRIWYDEGIVPGSEWPENIAQHLAGSTAVMVFVTPRSMNSDNCRSEITFAKTRQKPILSVVLERTDIPLGIELQLSAQQSVLRYNYSTEDAFLEKICACPSLEPCRGNSTPEEPGLLDKLKKKIQAICKKISGQGNVKRKLQTFLGIVAAAIVVIAAAVFIGNAASKTTIAGKTVKKNTSFISLTSGDISADDIAKINKLKKLTSLYMKDCTFAPCSAESLASGAATLSLTNCTGIDSFDFLANMQNLKSIAICSCGLAQLPDMTGYDLRSVELSGNSQFDGLNRLSLENVGTLNISGTAVTDLSPLAACKNLTRLYCSNNNISDVSALAGIAELRELDLSGCRISKITEPLECLYLTKLNLADNGLTDVSGFSDITVLKELDLSGNALTAVPWAEKNTATLT